MSAKLLALDVGAGDALIYSEEQWYLASLDRAWRPLKVDGREGAVVWGFSAWALVVDKEYENLKAAILEARRLCLTALERGMSYSMTPELLQELVEELQEQQDGRPNSERRFEGILWQFTRRLDRFFVSRGCSPDETLQLILEVFGAVYEDMPTEEGELARRLFEIAGNVYHEHTGAGRRKPAFREQIERRVGPEGGSFTEAQERRVLRNLSRQELRALYFWTLRRYGIREIAILMNSSLERVETDLTAIAERFHRPVEELQEAALTAGCFQELQRRREQP